MSTRTVTWGKALLAETVLAPGGLNQAVLRIQNTVGPQIGTRNSFAKLYKLDPSDLRPVDRWRAWLLLASIGQDPVAWGIYDDVVPAIFADRIEDIKRKCTPRDLNPEPTDYRSARGTRGSSRPRNRAGRTSPKGRAA